MSQEHIQNQPLLANQQPPPPPPAYYYPYQQPQAIPNQPLPPPPYYYPQQPLMPPPFTSTSPCPHCRRDTPNYLKKIPGGATWMWCLGLFIFTGIFCCLPFCIDGCQDTQLVCGNCHGVKGTWESTGCCC